LDNAFKGDAYQDFPPFACILAIAFSAIQVLPAPVGAVTRQSAFLIAESALSWKGSGLKADFSGTPMDEKTFFSLASAFGFNFSANKLLSVFFFLPLFLG